jgi:hypothetical protein
MVNSNLRLTVKRLEEINPGDEVMDGKTVHFPSERSTYNLQGDR